MKYILLDVNGTVGTDTVPILDKIANPDNYIWVERVLAHVKLSILEKIKELCDTYGATVLWVSLRRDDALVLNDLVDVGWGWLDIASVIDRSNEWDKTAAIAKFVADHSEDTIVLCDDMLLFGGSYNEIKGQAPGLKFIVPSASVALTDEDLAQLETYLR